MKIKQVNDPFLSIVIPTKDRPKLLRNCLDHLFTAPLDFSFEIVIVDGSKGNDTKMLCKEHVLAPQITYKPDPTGLKAISVPSYIKPTVAYMKGALYATGTYICYLGDDDYLMPEALNTILADLKNNKADACIPKMSAWDDIRKREIKEQVAIPHGTPEYTKNNLVDLFKTTIEHCLSPEYFIYKRLPYLKCLHYFPNTYMPLLMSFYMAKIGRLMLCPKTAFLLTTKSPFFSTDQRPTATPLLCEHTPDAMQNTFIILSLLLAQRDNPKPVFGMLKTPLSLLALYFRTMQSDGLIACVEQKKYLQALLFVMRYAFYDNLTCLTSPEAHFIKDYLPLVFTHALTQLIIVRFQLLDDVDRIFLYGFSNPQSLRDECFFHLDDQLPIEIWANDAPLHDLADRKNTFFVTRTESHYEGLLKQGLPAAHIISYEALNNLLSLPFLHITLNF